MAERLLFGGFTAITPILFQCFPRLLQRHSRHKAGNIVDTIFCQTNSRTAGDGTPPRPMESSGADGGAPGGLASGGRHIHLIDKKEF